MLIYTKTKVNRLKICETEEAKWKLSCGNVMRKTKHFVLKRKKVCSPEAPSCVKSEEGSAGQKRVKLQCVVEFCSEYRRHNVT